MIDTVTSTLTPNTTTKKEKPPKPGSKKAQLLKAQSKTTSSKGTDHADPYVMPNYAVHGQVLVLVFAKASSLKAALLQPHICYEGQQLNGPLKGVNFPVASFLEWSAQTPNKTLAETSIVDLVIGLEANKVIEDVVKPGSQNPCSVSSLAKIEPSAHADVLPTGASLQATDSANVLYIISGLKGDRSTFLHEWAHARFFLDASFKAESTRIWDALDPQLKRHIQKELLMRNYRPDVFVDEFQAYVLESAEDFGKRWAEHLKVPHAKLRSLVNLPSNIC
ncbi:hypothetical protein QVD99_006335 [Batrachochytrium dendrobatidis]|nr:hypothetical protein O5D80_003320 [Batrachochytrium dendrobatidis]KAK5667124.1 hypothetical protein QVD99_006335 [Batrachochytrium dendrobatidis]